MIMWIFCVIRIRFWICMIFDIVVVIFGVRFGVRVCRLVLLVVLLSS